MASPSTLGAGGDIGGVAGGAVSGAAAGSVLGPYGAIAGMAIGAIGGIIGAGGAAEAGQATANMYNYKAGIALMNKQINLQNADYERAAGEVAAQESGMRTRAVVGQEKAAQAGSGLDVNTGSAAAVRESQVEIGQQDENIIRSNAARRAYGYEVEATQDQSQASLYGMAASQARIAGDIGAATSLLSAGTSVAAKWSQASQVGAI